MVMDKTVKIYGRGWVGSAMHQLFPNAAISDPLYSLNSDKVCDVAFICVPTPLKDGKLDISIVESIVSICLEDLIVIRSTVNPGDCDHLMGVYNKNIVYQPEYLGETPDHPFINAKTRPFLVIGGRPSQRIKLINLYTKVYNANISIRQLTLLEAEVVKLTENRAIAFKVMQMHELYLACQASGVDYYTIRDTVYGDDPRLNLWFTMIYDQLGFDSSKCLSKDVPAWAAWCASVGADPSITDALVYMSHEYAKL